MPAMNETTYPRFWAEHGLIDEVCVIYFSWVQPPWIKQSLQVNFSYFFALCFSEIYGMIPNFVEGSQIGPK